MQVAKLEVTDQKQPEDMFCLAYTGFLKIWTQCLHLKIRRFLVNTQISACSGNKAKVWQHLFPSRPAFNEVPFSPSPHLHPVLCRSLQFLPLPVTVCVFTYYSTCLSLAAFGYLTSTMNFMFPEISLPLLLHGFKFIPLLLPLQH
jgi:hypothetical protein